MKLNINYFIAAILLLLIEILIGLFICSHDPELTEEAIVKEVQIEKKASK